MFKKFISGIMCLAMVVSLAACSDSKTSSDSVTLGEDSSSSASSAVKKNDSSEGPVITESDEIYNFTEPVEGEKVAVLDIEGYGQVKIKLFPEQCPKGVENFENLINSGYYDGLTFHRVIKDFMIQGGDPTGTGGGGQSIWGKGFAQEINTGLRHFSGAVSYATAIDKLNGSQFFIVTGLTNIDSDHFDSLQTQYNKSYSDEVKELYYEKGGYPFLDGDYEVFGQVFEGLDICFEIASVATDSSDKPTDEVVINYARMEEYKK